MRTGEGRREDRKRGERRQREGRREERERGEDRECRGYVEEKEQKYRRRYDRMLNKVERTE